VFDEERYATATAIGLLTLLFSQVLLPSSIEEWKNCNCLRVEDEATNIIPDY
jgi:hypothetical protein